MPLTEIQIHNIEQYLKDPTNWTDKAQQTITKDIKSLVNMYVMLKDVIAEMRDEHCATENYWADRIEKALANAE